MALKSRCFLHWQKFRLELIEKQVEIMKKNCKEISLEHLYTCRPSYLWSYLRSETLGYWSICIYLMFEYVRPQSIYAWIDIFPWAQTFLLLSFSIALFQKKDVSTKVGTTTLIAIYGVIVLISSAFAVWPSLAFNNLGSFGNWVLAYYAIVRLVNTRRRFFMFFLLYMLCNLKMSQHGFFTWAFRGFSFSGWGVSGAPGWFRNSGEFGIQMTIFVPLSIAFFIALRNFWGIKMRMLFLFFPMSGAGSILASSSRGALLGLAASGVWLMKSNKYFFKSLFILSILALLVFIVLPDEFKDRFESSGEDRTSTIRIDRWEKGIDTALKFPFFGVGHKNWDKYYRKNLDYGQVGTSKTHNIFIESLTEHGFIGFFVLLLIIFSMFRSNKRVRAIAEKNSWSFERYIAFGLDFSTIGLLVSASFVTVLYYPYIWIHAAFVAALYVSTFQADSRLNDKS